VDSNSLESSTDSKKTTVNKMEIREGLRKLFERVANQKGEVAPDALASITEALSSLAGALMNV
jgi:hypothetical protein